MIGSSIFAGRISWSVTIQNNTDQVATIRPAGYDECNMGDFGSEQVVPAHSSKTFDGMSASVIRASICGINIFNGPNPTGTHVEFNFDGHRTGPNMYRVWEQSDDALWFTIGQTGLTLPVPPNIKILPQREYCAIITATIGLENL